MEVGSLAHWLTSRRRWQCAKTVPLLYLYVKYFENSIKHDKQYNPNNGERNTPKLHERTYITFLPSAVMRPNISSKVSLGTFSYDAYM